MKTLFRIICLCVLLVSFNCKSKTTNSFVTISGVIDNSVDSILTVSGGRLNKIIILNKFGEFSDTLGVDRAKIYKLYLNDSKKGFIFLKNGYNLNTVGDANNFFMDLI